MFPGMFGTAIRLLPRLGAAAVLSALVACVPESQNPAGDPARAVKDPAIFGLWESDWEDGKLFLHVLDGGQGMIEVFTVAHKRDGAGEVDHYQGFVANVGKRHIANLQLADSGGEDSGEAETYVFIAYQMDPNDRLEAHFIDDKPFIAAVAAGKLTGQITGQGEGQTVLLNDDTAKIAAFIAATDDASLYSKDLLFRRVYPKPGD